MRTNNGQVFAVASWVGEHVALLLCLLWYPLTVGVWGTTFPVPLGRGLAFVIHRHGEAFLLLALLILIALLFYSIAVAEGYLVGTTWCARAGGKHGLLWQCLQAGVMIGLQVYVSHTFLFGLFSLLGLVALCGQGQPRRLRLVVFAVLVGIGLLAFAVGSLGRAMQVVAGPPRSAPSVGFEVMVLALEVLLPSALLVGSALMTVRRSRRSEGVSHGV